MQGVKEGISQVQEATKTALKAPDQALAQVDLAMKQMDTAVQEGIGQARKTVTSKSGEVAEKLPVRAQQEIKAKLDSADQALNQAQVKLTEQRQALQGKIDQYRQALNTSKVAIDVVVDKANEFQAGIDSQIAQVSGEVDNAFSEVGSTVEAGKQAVSTAQTTANGVLGTLGVAWNNATETAGKATEKISSAGRTLANGNITDAGKQVAGAVVQTVTGAATTAIKTGQSATNTGIDTTTGAVQGAIQSGKTQIKAALSDAQSQIKSTLAEATSSLTGSLNQGKEALSVLEKAIQSLDQAQQAIDSSRATIEKARQRFEGLKK